MLDHGILNVPLSKRGNIDAQLDRYKKEQAQLALKAKKIQDADYKDAQQKAKSMVAGLSEECLAEMMARHKLTRKQLDVQLQAVARSRALSILNAAVALDEINRQIKARICPFS